MPQHPRPGRPQAALLLPILLVFLLAAGCARLPDPVARRQSALAMAAPYGLRPVPVPTADTGLPVLALGRDGPGDDLVVYIEGDGLAFLDRVTPSPDPTPVHPLALKLALVDPAPKRAYLGRPCQYGAPLPARCAQRVWTLARFGPETIAALDAALDRIKAALHAKRLHLVGYSGGAAMAVLLATRRNDVASLVTVAGNLDIVTFADWHHVTPLTGSRNPLDVAPAVARLPQVHVNGSADHICPPFLATRFLDREGSPATARRIIVPGATHHQGLLAAWPGLLARIRQQPGMKPIDENRTKPQ